MREAPEHQQQHSAPARFPGQPEGDWAGDDDAPGRYTTAAICQRGHALTADAERHPVAKFCADCGPPVITTCPGCGTGIRGHFVPPGVTGVGGHYTPPNFCFSCGRPFPWTTEKLAAARDLADELEGISADDRAKLSGRAAPGADVGRNVECPPT